MKKIFQLTTLLAMALVVFSCTKKEVSTEQFDTTAVVLKAYGPQPVVRGGILRFVGSNLDKVATVTLPGVSPITPEVVTSGTHSEIRITVPKDGPEVGYPVLNLSDGTTITGKTQITYDEPILIDEISPLSVYPGDKITLTGDYLNLLHEVIFTNDVKVSEDDFVEHTRYKIVVEVPEEAQTGMLAVGTVDESKLEDGDDALASLNMMELEEITVGTATGTFPEAPIKAGSQVVIKGSHMLLVEEIEINHEYSVLEFDATDTQITFELSEAAPDGEVCLVMASGIAVPIGDLTTVAPSELAVNPDPVKAGATLKVTGKDLELVNNITVGGVDLSDFTCNEAGTEISFPVPEKAVEGDIVLIMVNRKQVTVPFTLVKPVVTAFSANPASAGSDVTITGTDLDLVKSVTFPGADAVVVEASETEIVVAVPTAAETGNIVLNLKNGTSVDVETELAIDKPAGAYIAAFPTDQYKKGDMFIVDIQNADHLTGVQIDGTDVNYLLTGDKLYVVIPDFAKADSQLTLVSDNGSVTYTMNIDPGDKLEVTVWTGPSGHTGDYASNQELGGEDDWVNAGLQEGDEIRIYFTPDDPSDWSIQVFDGHWNGMGYVTPNGTQWNAENDPEAVERGYVSFRASGDAFTALTTKAWWGSAIILQGKNMVFSRITYVHYYPQETVVWTGPSGHTGDYASNQELGGEDDWVNAGLQEGDEIRIYFTPDNPSDWSIQVFDGHWNGMGYVTPNGTQWNVENDPEATDRGYVSFVASGDAFTALTTKAWWGSALILQGKNMVFDKLSFVHIP